MKGGCGCELVAGLRSTSGQRCFFLLRVKEYAWVQCVVLMMSAFQHSRPSARSYSPSGEQGFVGSALASLQAVALLELLWQRREFPARVSELASGGSRSAKTVDLCWNVASFDVV